MFAAVIPTWTEVYEHDRFGSIEVTWLDRDRTHLIAIQSELWTPAEEIAACVEWARNLHDGNMTRGGEAAGPVPSPVPF